MPCRDHENTRLVLARDLTSSTHNVTWLLNIRFVSVVWCTSRQRIWQLLSSFPIISYVSHDLVFWSDSLEWKKFAKKQAVIWRQTAVQWITHSPRIHVTHYEYLQENTYSELVKIVQFLDVPVEPQRILCSIQEHPSSKSTGISLGAFSREMRVYLTNDPFTSDIRKVIDDNIRKVNQTLILHQLTPLPKNYSLQVF